MSFFGGSRSTPEDGSLNSLLNTPALRTDFVLVVALSSDAMRRELISVFDLEGTQTRNPQQKENNNDADSSHSTRPLDQLLLLPDKKHPRPEAQQQQQQQQQQQHSVLVSPQTDGLKRAALTFFDKWQIDVLRRLGEVLSVRPDAVRRARAQAKQKADSAAKAMRDQDFLDWANGDDASPASTDEAQPDILYALDLALLRLQEPKRILLLNSLLLLLLSLEQYTAHSRVLLVRVAAVFRLAPSTPAEHESKVAQSLLATAASHMSADESTQRKAAEEASARRWKVGLATVAGAALIGVTGGLAAPVLAASLGSIMGGLGLGAVAALLGPLATNVVLIGGLFGAYGGRMTGEMAQKYAQEVRDFKILPLTNQSSTDDTTQHKLRVVIGISGTLTSPTDITTPWEIFTPSSIEPFALRWEVDSLIAFGDSLHAALTRHAWDFAKWQLLTSLVAGLWPLGLLRMATALDTPFSVAVARADRAAAVLADALVHRVQGERPVTLVGASLGARLVLACLTHLADRNAFGLVESVVLLGAPAPSDADMWRRARAVVAGRVVNVYSRDDFLLGFVYRASKAQVGVAGLGEVRGVGGVENVDATDLVKSHVQWGAVAGTLLERVGLADVDVENVRRQQQGQHRQGQQELVDLGQTDAPKPELDDRQAAKEVDGRIIMVDEEGAETLAAVQADDTIAMSHRDPLPLRLSDQVDADDAASDIASEPSTHSGPIEMTEVEPEPEPDCGPSRETRRFGSGERGFDVVWDSSGKA